MSENYTIKGEISDIRNNHGSKIITVKGKAYVIGQDHIFYDFLGRVRKGQTIELVATSDSDLVVSIKVLENRRNRSQNE